MQKAVFYIGVTVLGGVLITYGNIMIPFWVKIATCLVGMFTMSWFFHEKKFQAFQVLLMTIVYIAIFASAHKSASSVSLSESCVFIFLILRLCETWLSQMKQNFYFQRAQ